MEEKYRTCICGGKAALKFEDAQLFDGQVILKNQPFYRCTRCGNEYVTSGQMRGFLDDAKEKIGFERQAISTGGSIGVTFPPQVSQHYKIKKGTKMRMVPDGPKKLAIILE